jgi:3-isopropylmalate dehydrogenase
VGAILSTALLLRHSLHLPAEAAAVEAAVEHVLRAGPYTSDLGGRAGTTEVRDAVLAALSSQATGSATTTRATDSCCG